MSKIEIFKEVKGLYKIIPLTPFRKTPGVIFDIVPHEAFPRIDGIDRVIHQGGAISPGAVGEVEFPWYMHPHQEDYFLVLQGTRFTDIYTPEHGVVESFEISPQMIKQNNEVVFDGPAMLVWTCSVFHRIRSSEKNGSISMNFAARYEGFDIKTNFNIYDVDIEKGTYQVIREGFVNQF